MSHYMKLATEAAELEREQCYYQARSVWQKAATHTRRSDNRHWCLSRADYCGRTRRRLAPEANPTTS